VTRTWLAPLLLATLWGVGPALPGLLSGDLLGQPFTDLYPSVWGLWWFAEQQPGLPTWTTALAAPDGMGFYYSSPLKGWLAAIVMPWVGLTATWNLLIVLARVATVVMAHAAARAWGLSERGALVAAAVYGCAPFFQGFAVEGIVEGTDGWALALWLWAVGRRRLGWAGFGFALTVVSSWYMAATACVLAVLIGPRAWAGAAIGLALASPALHGFLGAFPDRAPLDSATRVAMGSSFSIAAPGLSEGLQPFAKTSWVGVLAPVTALLAVRRKLAVAGALLLLVVLSTGMGPHYEVPPFSSLRFPYRFHAGTLACLALLAGVTADRWRRGAWLAPLIALEGLLLSPIEPILPTAVAAVPALYADAGSVVLDVPGPVAMPPGTVNRSRPRARWFLYAQTAHDHATPWRPDFNAVGVPSAQDGLDAVRALDPLTGLDAPTRLDLPTAIDSVMLHHRGLGRRLRTARTLLEAEGWVLHGRDGERTLYRRAP